MVQRFRDSEDALEQLRERLHGLVLAEDIAGRAAASIETSAAALSVVAASLESVVAELSDARRITVEALEAAQTFLGGTDLGALREEVSSLRKRCRDTC